jgi:hypothetical protein
MDPPPAATHQTGKRNHLIRSDLLKTLISEEQSRKAAAGTTACPDDTDVIAMVRAHPGLSNPSWAMEELARIDPSAATWERTTMPPKSWCHPLAAAAHGVPGPFTVTPEDSVKFS